MMDGMGKEGEEWKRENWKWPTNVKGERTTDWWWMVCWVDYGDNTPKVWQFLNSKLNIWHFNTKEKERSVEENELTIFFYRWIIYFWFNDNERMDAVVNAFFENSTNLLNQIDQIEIITTSSFPFLPHCCFFRLFRLCGWSFEEQHGDFEDWTDSESASMFLKNSSRSRSSNSGNFPSQNDVICMSLLSSSTCLTRGEEE